MLGTIVVLLIVALDQIVKFISKSVLTTLPGDTYPLWDGVFHFSYVENRGAAFGILGGARGFLLVFTVILVGVLIWAIVKFRDNPSKLFRASLYMILGGAIGNLIDRIVLGYVIDMLDFRLINFAVFNVADSFVCVGTVLLIIDILYRSENYFKEKWKGKSGRHDKNIVNEKAEENPLDLQTAENLAEQGDVESGRCEEPGADVGEQASQLYVEESQAKNPQQS